MVQEIGNMSLLDGRNQLFYEIVASSDVYLKTKMH